ncbi:MAG TPA: hypothetical protein EYQ01_01130 [Nitrospira sp.]|nr:hypothetical protein [Candidatus Manganitrophaceae bacterium]
MVLDPVEQADYRAALKALKTSGTGLRVAAEEHAKAIEILGGNLVLEAARFYAKRNIHTLPKITVTEACQTFIDSIDRVPYRKLIRTNLKRFSESFHIDLKMVQSPDIDDFIRNLKLSERTKKNTRMAVAALFSFGVSRGWIPRDHDVMNGVRSYGDGDGEVLIYSVAEMEKLMHFARPEMVHWLAIAAFAGLRHAEIQRLDWSDIDDEFITVGKAKSKTRTRRLVPVAGNLKTWLKPFWKPSGPVSQFSIVCDQLEKVSKSSGIKWKKNGLRHSYISYRLAKTQDVNAVAIEAGNSPAIIFVGASFIKC